MTANATGTSGRLSLSSLARLHPRAQGPAYDPRACSIGIVHLGLGNFHRAHQAVHVDDALAAGERAWAISGISLRKPAMANALGPQDGLYTLLTREGDDARARVIGSIREALYAPGQPESVLERLASPQTRIVSMTITEKGYGIGADGILDATDPDIAADLQGAWPPRSALGWLASGIRARMNGQHSAKLTLLSCDNLSRNGQTLANALRQFLAKKNAFAEADWLDRHASFPDAMVDRIVPATTDADRQAALTATGLEDAWPVSAEGFSQWVLQDRFAAGRPEWEKSGVQFVSDVGDWELMKLRLLNAAHSCIAYLGDPAGLATVDAAIATPEIRVFIERFWRDEAIACLPDSVRTMAPAYCERLITRFGNPAIGHRTRQIAMDGSKKIVVRWLPTLRARLAKGEPAQALRFALAAWIRYLSGVDENGMHFRVDDPEADRLAPLARQPDPVLAVRSVMACTPIFGDLGASEALTSSIAQALQRLRTLGTLAALREFQVKQ